MAKGESSCDKPTPAEEEQMASQSMEDNLALSTIHTTAQSTSEPTDPYHNEVIISLEELSFKEDEPSSELVKDASSLTVPKAESNSRLSQLPTEVIIKVMGYLNPVSAVCLSLAARKFQNIYYTFSRSPLPIKLESKSEEEVPLYVLVNTWMERMGFTLVVAELFGLEYRGDIKWTMWEETSLFKLLRLVDIKDEALAKEYTKRCTETALDDLDDPVFSILWGEFDFEYFIWQIGVGSPVPGRDQLWASIYEYYERRKEIFE
ncbi:hypothetical protein HYALB_00011868 [Hymenoscyphus albidus]|uniref:F-box domain-containing protein n=1 Tax=Hymenoscyphus albidus TaxID=595503 RepID=A0A9N9Q6G3_9HELO|nr:hypothetical protein HYALB_00011868 [Hymenoscyphus albidus]